MKTQIISHIRKAVQVLPALLILASPALADGSSTFKSVCAECHTGGFKGFMSGAPNVQKPATWQKFLARDSDQRMYEIVLRGTADHKARGGCASCTDQQIAEALDYILKRVK